MRFAPPRPSHVLWNSGSRFMALALQSRISEVFAVDIHPAARIGKGLLLDHATGVVIGETAVIGDFCSMLQARRESKRGSFEGLCVICIAVRACYLAGGAMGCDAAWRNAPGTFVCPRV